MPFKSPKQRKFLFANHPKIAKRWAAEAGGGPKPKQKPKPKGKNRGKHG